jgi:hypothetical protein
MVMLLTPIFEVLGSDVDWDTSYYLVTFVLFLIPSMQMLEYQLSQATASALQNRSSSFYTI